MGRVIVIALLLLGFDHTQHATQTGDALTCVQCHPTTKTSLRAPAHAQCFGACHGPLPTAKAPALKGRETVCAACHAQPAATDKATLAARPQIDPDFVLVVGHKRHAPVACASCHPTKPAAPHVRCAGCHTGGEGKGTTMALCTSCHVLGDHVDSPAEQARVRVTTAFSHPKHAARGTKCATCHTTDTDASDLPNATAETCAIAGCHDAKAAFPTTAACTRCHQDVPAIKFVVARPERAFSHEQHLPVVAFVTCSTCHPIAKSGEVGIANHTVCATCHAEDFGSRTPRTCGACHDATEPWRKLVPDRPSLPASDFGASLDHGKHPSSCATCHSLTTAATQLRPPRGHASCTGKSCHAVSAGPAPQMASCGSCHELGLSAQREAQRQAAKWSVRETFSHAKHERASDGNPLPCVACHLDMRGADLMSLATPPKSACVPCHDGKTSFKLTGTGCTRCHPGASR